MINSGAEIKRRAHTHNHLITYYRDRQRTRTSSNAVDFAQNTE